MRALVIALILLASSVAFGSDELKFDNVEIVIGDFLEVEGGGWSPDASPLSRPFGIDFNKSGQMFIVELEGGRIHRREKNGELLWVAGDGSKGFGGDGKLMAEAVFNGMHNCAVTKTGDLYVADTWNHRIRLIDGKTAKVSTVAGTGEAGFSGDGGIATDAQFHDIMCITLSPDEDVLHIADLKNRRIRALDLESGIVTTVAGNGKKGVPTDGDRALSAPLFDPRAVVADSKNNIYVLERGGHALRIIRPDGTISTIAGTGEKGFKDGAANTARFAGPKHICVAADDSVYIADDLNNAIRRYDPESGAVTTVLGRGYGEENLKLSHPHGVCWENGELYVVDSSHNRILKLKTKRAQD